jgi:lipopolysaccharide transport system permease protein
MIDTSALPIAQPRINRADLARMFLTRQLRLVAKRTFLGVLLPIGIPVMLFLLYTFVFHSIFKVGIARYPVYLFSGLIPWTYLSQTLSPASTSLSREAELLRRVRFPYAFLPMSSTAAGIVFMLVTLVGFVIVLAATGHLHPALLPLLVFPIVAVYLFVTGIALVLSVIDVFNRDLRSLLGNIITIWFFLVPIAYSQSTLSHRLGVVARDDPVTFIVGEFREVLYWGHFGDPLSTVTMMVICGGFFSLCLLFFTRATRDLAKDV